MRTTTAILAVAFLLGLAGCAVPGTPVAQSSACKVEASYECQVERYNKAY